LRFARGAQPQSEEGIAERRVSEWRQCLIDLGHARRIDRPERLGASIVLGARTQGNGSNLSDSKNHLSDLGGCELFVQRHHQSVPHHAEVVEPHRIRDVDNQAAVPDGVRLGVPSDLRSDHE
jgi:hypothetical protein